MKRTIWSIVFVVACGGKSGTTPSDDKMGKMDSMMMSNKSMPADEASKF